MNKPLPYGKYQLLERVNVGGMAEVFKAKAFGVEGFERIVALKRILPSIAADEEFIGMFIDEAKLAVQLSHENIARIFELGYEAGTHYIEMEFVAGKDARALIDQTRARGERLPVPLCAYVAMKVCAGLDYAHDKCDPMGQPLDLVHRDVSPQNILISYAGEIKIIDFGIAKAASQAQQTQVGILKGKFGYMSPEQARGLALDRRSDVFAAGILLYELLSGQRLFYGDTDIATLEMVRNAEIPSLRAINPAVSPELERIVMGALTLRVEDRYQSAMDMHDALHDFLVRGGTRFGERELGEVMRRVFAEEVARDPSLATSASARPRRTSTSDALAQAVALPPQPAPVADEMEWDDDDEATTVFDNKDLDFSIPPEAMAAPVAAAPYSHPIAPSSRPPAPIDSVIPMAPAVPMASARAGAPSPFDDLPPGPGPSETLRRAEATEVVRRERHKQATPALIAAVIALAVLAGIAFAFLRPGTPGTIHLRTDPHNAEVFFDEQRIAATSSPFTITGVSADELHLLEVRSPGFESWAAPIELTSGQTLDVGDVTLVPETMHFDESVALEDSPAEPAPTAVVAPEEPTPVAEAPVVEPAPAPEPVAEAPARRRRTREEPVAINSFVAGDGTLRINSRPASQVYVDGRFIGPTPQMAITLPAGRHRVRLVNTELGREQTLTVSINGGQTVTKVIDL